MKRLVNAASSRHIVVNALRVSAVVGTMVNLINQSGPVLQGHAPSWLHIGLNYLMPYLVASYSAARNELGLRDRTVVPVSARAPDRLGPPVAGPAGGPDRLPGHMDLFLRHADTAPEHLFSFAQFVADNEFLSADPRFSAAWRDAETFSATAFDEWDRAGRPADWDAVWNARHRAHALLVIESLKTIAMARPVPARTV